jgi:hypothetical protein
MFSGQPIYEDFGAANIQEAPEPKRGETVYCAFNASPTETVCVAGLADRRRFCVS